MRIKEEEIRREVKVERCADMSGGVNVGRVFK